MATRSLTRQNGWFAAHPGSIPGVPFFMTPPETLPLFKAAVENVRAIDHGIRIFRQDLNKRLRRGSTEDLERYTRIYGMLFCTWAEACLLRIIYTPYGFSAGQISTVLDARTIEDKWTTCLQFAFHNSEIREQKSLKQAVGPTLERLITNIVTTPAQIRNKIAHGQWKQPFNSNSTALNPGTAILMQAADVIEIDRWFFVFAEFAQIVEDGIESPERAFRRDVWARLDSIENELRRRMAWTVESKRKALMRHNRKGVSSTT